MPALHGQLLQDVLLDGVSFALLTLVPLLHTFRHLLYTRLEPALMGYGCSISHWQFAMEVLQNKVYRIQIR